MPLPPPGWYADPSGATGQRYFDGKDWTEYRVGWPALPLTTASPPSAPPPSPTARYASKPSAPASPAPPHRRIPAWGWVAISAGMLIVLIAVISIVASGGDNSPPSTSTTTPHTGAAPSSPTKPTPNPLKSQLIGVTMPPGSRQVATGWCADCDHPHEEWVSGAGLDDTVS
jgi:hypothetical protein